MVRLVWYNKKHATKYYTLQYVNKMRNSIKEMRVQYQHTRLFFSTETLENNIMQLTTIKHSLGFIFF